MKGSYCQCHYCKCEHGFLHCGKEKGYGGHKGSVSVLMISMRVLPLMMKDVTYRYTPNMMRCKEAPIARRSSVVGTG